MNTQLTIRRRLLQFLKRIQYNAPVVLTFSLLAVAVQGVSSLWPSFTPTFFGLPSEMSLLNPLSYFRLVFYTAGHGGWEHLLSNLTFILLLGPILEEKYGSRAILWMMFFTALCTGLIHVLLFSQSLLVGASGIVFMLITLASIVDVKEGFIPLTFILIATIFLGTELINAFQYDNISQTAHIIGGVMGAIFGFKGFG
ncbi:MAG: rhomboid family intramembrane serine protease [Ardenticatenaceae bacterium]